MISARAASIATLFALFFTAKEAAAIRFTLGLESAFTPLVLDPPPIADPNAGPQIGNVRLALRPVLDVETSRNFAIGAYTPFTLLRFGEGSDTGAESIFALGASIRYPIVRDIAPEEFLFYGTIRGGLGTADGRAGLFYGFAFGAAMTWLETGRGLFAELSAGHVGIPGGGADRPFPEVDRWLFGLSIGVVFRLGGEAWRIEPKREANAMDSKSSQR